MSLTVPQRRLLADVRESGRVVRNGRARRTVEALARAGLVDVEYDLVPHATGNGMTFTERFTVTPTPATFADYFSVADELDGGLTLDDLDAEFVDEARYAATSLRLPWPPDLATAEEYALDLHAREARERRARAEELRVGGTD